MIVTVSLDKELYKRGGSMANTKLYVLTGFLGAGKTTILLHLLKELKGRKIGVIQNEFGKVGIDGEILRNDDIQMVEINKGSIFCSCLKLSFVEALTEMGKQDFEYLFVESSGLGDPSNVEEILNVVEQTSNKKYDFKGCICLVDCINFFDQLEDLETVYRQLKHCHLAVLTKVDLVSEDEINKILLKIREINPICEIVRSSNGNLKLDFLEEDLLKYQWAESEETTNSEETKPKTLFMNCLEPVEKTKLTAFLTKLSKDVYRMKGFVECKEDGWNQVDVVGKRIDYKKCEAKDQAQMIVISKIGPAIIKPIIEDWKNEVNTKMELKN